MLQPITLTRSTAASMLAALIAGAPWLAPFAGLASAIDNQGIDTTLLDLTPVVGAAGVRQAIIWGTPYELADGSAVVDSETLVYTPAGVEEDSVAAVYIATLVAAGTLMAFMPESVPVAIRALRPYSLVVRLTLDPVGRWSVSLSWDGVA